MSKLYPAINGWAIVRGQRMGRCLRDEVGFAGWIPSAKALGYFQGFATRGGMGFRRPYARLVMWMYIRKPLEELMVAD